jgi:plastocyanin
MWTRKVGLLAVVFFGIGLNADAKPKKKVAAHVVTIKGFKFDPPELTVKSGERVEWVNEDILPHTATAKGKQFDSGSIGSKGHWGWTAKDKGGFAYGCNFHPTMKAVLTVK